MTTNRRFYYRHSHVYGWCVYDADRNHEPAYDACSDLLAPVKVDDSGSVSESPVLLKNEYAAMSLCRRLNVAHKKQAKES